MSRRQPSSKSRPASDADAMRPEYDFSKGVRGATAKRSAEGTNVIVLAPDLAKVSPDSESVNDPLRVPARLAKPRPGRSGRRRPA